MPFSEYSPWRLTSVAYRNAPSSAHLHTMPLLYHSVISTTNNSCANGSDSCRNATGPIGNPSGFAFSSYVESTSSKVRAVNRALTAGDYLYYLQGDVIWKAKYADVHAADPEATHDGFIGNPWSVVYTLASVKAGRVGRNTGLYSCILNVSGVHQPFVVCAWNLSDDTSWQGVRISPIDNTIDVSPAMNIGILADEANGGVKAEILWDNKIYFIGNTTDGIGVYSPAGHELKKISWESTATIWGPHDFCGYKNRLWVLNRDKYGGGGNNNLHIWEMPVSSGSSIYPRLAYDIDESEGVTISSEASEPTAGRYALFTDRTYLYAMALTNTAIETFRLTANDAGTVTFDGTCSFQFSYYNTTRANVFTTQHLNPDIETPSISGQLITINMDQEGVSGCPLYQGVLGNTANIVQEESVGSGSQLHAERAGLHNFYLDVNARPHCKNGGGERIFQPDSTIDFGGNQGVLPVPFGGCKVEITRLSTPTGSGAVKISFQTKNSPGDFPAGTPCAVQLRFNEDKDLPFRRGKLQNPSVGTLVENNTVMRIPSSASGVTYTVEWDYRNAGMVYTDRPAITLFASTSGAA